MLKNLDTVIAFATVMLLLSLLVTTLVQMAGAVLGLRGRNLLWGVKRLLVQIDGNLSAHAREISDRLLRHPSVTPSRRPAVAIRKEELVRLLTSLSEPVWLPDPPLRKKIRASLAAHVKCPVMRRWLVLPFAWLFPHPARSLQLSSGAKEAIKNLLAKTVPGATPEEIARVQGVAASLSDLLPSQAQAVQSVVNQVLAQTNQLAAETNAWFDTVMDRTSDRFKLHTRYITIFLAALFAVAFHIDSLAILRQLSSDDDLRTQLVQMSGKVLDDGERLLAPEGSQLATKALRKLAKDPSQPDVASAVTSLCPGGDIDLCFADLTTRQEGRAVLAKLIEGQRAKALATYEEAFTTVAKDRLTELGVSFESLQGYLQQTRLQIIPSSIPPWNLSGRKRDIALEILGVAMTALFLGLGAPFWYNALRRLSDLRPIVARRVDGEPPKGAPRP